MSTKITLIGINFYPEDTAIGLYSTEMADYLSKNGFFVDVITGFPYYPQWKINPEYSSYKNFIVEKRNNINIYRYKQYVPMKPNFLKRIIHLLDFTFGSLFNLKKIKETDIIIVVVPFTSGILLGWLLKRKTKAKLWIHVQDFEFDAALQAGITKSNKTGITKKVIFNILFKLEKWLFSKADVASSISFSMLDKLKKKTDSFTPIHYFPNWIDVEKFKEVKNEKHCYLNSTKFKILYSGNIGEKQDWEFFIRFIDLLNCDEVDVVVVGDGSKKEWLLEKIKKYHYVNYFSPVPYNELPNLLNSADLHILFQKEDILDTVMPSKLLGMMCSGKPSLVTGNPESEVKKIIDESNGGIYESKSNIEKIMNELEILIKNKHKNNEIGHNAKSYILNKFQSQNILKSFVKEIKKM